MGESGLLERSERLLAGSTSIDGHHPLDMRRPVTLEELAPDLAFVEAFANVVAVRTDEGLVLIDAAGPLHAQAVHQAIRGWAPDPERHRLHTAVFTHGHVDHIYAVARFESEPGAAPATVVAHEALPDRFRRYERTDGYNAVINQRQFQLAAPIFPGNYRYPDRTYRDRLDVVVGGVTFDLRHDRGETDDGTWVWLADRQILCTGDLFIWASPNCGNPQKVQRYCDEWAIALRRMAELDAELLLPGHGLPIAGADRIRTVLTETAELLESIFDQTIEMMNAGARLDEIVHTVVAPAHLLARPWLQPVYDEPEFVVRNIWRLYGGWYDGDPSNLKPAPAGALATELAALAGGASRLAARAVELSDAGDHRLAGHLAELASQAAPDDPDVRQARATVFGRRARVERSTMAKGVFSWAEHESRPDEPVAPETRRVIVDAAIYHDGRRLGGTLTFDEVKAHCQAPDTFAWIGLIDPSVDEARQALAAIRLPTRFAEGLTHRQSRSRLEIGDHAVQMMMGTARYIEPDQVELGQVAAAVGPDGILVVRIGQVDDLRPLRAELEDDAATLAQGPKRVLREIVGLVLDGYPRVLEGVAEDINEVEEQVFSSDAGRIRPKGSKDPTQRIYELNREVLNLRRAIGPLTDAINQLADESRTRLPPEEARWFRDLVDEAKRTRENVDASDALLSNILSANLTQVSLRQNEDMRKISAWAAILAFPTAIAGIYGMNFRHMPEIEQVWGYPAVLTLMAGGCLLLYRRFKRVGWL